MKRLSLLAAFAITAVAALETTPSANAVVYCAAGYCRAGCVARRSGYYGAPYVGVRGVARRTARRTSRRVYRRSDMMLKHDIAVIGHLHNGLGFYRFSYNGSDKAYVGVIAQEVQLLVPGAVRRAA